MVTREQRGIAHVLVLPTRHVETLLDLRDDEATAIINEIRAVAGLIDSAYERPGISVWQNNGEPANQTIPHMHFHIAGTLEGGGTAWGPVHELSVGETDDIARRLRTVQDVR